MPVVDVPLWRPPVCLSRVNLQIQMEDLKALELGVWALEPT